MDILSIACQFQDQLKRKKDKEPEPQPICPNLVDKTTEEAPEKKKEKVPGFLNAQDAELVAWFLSDKDLPLDPFQLKKGVTVMSPDKFYESLRLDIESGEKGPRAIFGALQDDLYVLRNRCVIKKHCEIQIKRYL